MIKAKRAAKPKAKRAAKTTNAARSASSSGVRKSASLRGTTAIAVIMTPPAPEISWDDAVAEGKRLVAEGKRLDAEGKRLAVAVDKNDWRLAELADQVVKKYGQNKLGQFTSEIGATHCAVKRRRTTYRKWKETLKGDPGLLSSLSYSVARALETHPERVRLIKENPEMTKRDADALMKTYRNPPEKKTQRLWKDLIVRAGKAPADENFLNLDRRILLEVVEPTVLSTIREAGQAWVRLADGLEKLFEPANEASFDGR